MNSRFAIMLTVVRLVREHGPKVQVPFMASEMALSYNYLTTLVIALVKGGVLVSQPGRGGGYSLARPVVTVWDVYKVACGDGGLPDDTDVFVRQTAGQIRDTMEKMAI